MNIDNERSRTILKRSLFSYLFEILWRSALFTAILSLVDYFFRPKAFNMEDVWFTFIAIVIGMSVITFLVLLMAAGTYRSHTKDEGDEDDR